MRGDAAVMRIEGRGTYATATALQQFGTIARKKGVRLLVLDGCSCEAMDSTFIGTIVGLASGYKRVGGRVLVVRISTRLQKTFVTLGIERAVHICEVSDLPTGIIDDVHFAEARPSEFTPDSVELHRMVIEAHETLSEISDKNRSAFKDVLAFLREELQQKQAKE